MGFMYRKKKYSCRNVKYNISSEFSRSFIANKKQTDKGEINKNSNVFFVKDYEFEKNFKKRQSVKSVSRQSVNIMDVAKAKEMCPGVDFSIHSFYLLSHLNNISVA